MTVEDFQKVAIGSVENLLAKVDDIPDLKTRLLIKGLGPLINLSVEALRTQLRENPEEVYKWLVMAREELEKTLKKYEDKSES